MSALDARYLLLGSMTLFLGGCNTDVMVPTPDGGLGAGGGGTTQISQLQVTPAQSRLPTGLQEQLLIKATMDDGSMKDLAGDALIKWSSSDDSVATVDGAGLVTGVGAGSATIKATRADSDKVVEANAQLQVTDAFVTDLAISPTTASSMPPTASQPLVTTKFVASATLSDNTVLDLTNNPALSWSSSDVAVATVNNVVGSKGLATPVGVGTTSISVSGMLNGQNFTATADLTVTP